MSPKVYKEIYDHDDMSIEMNANNQPEVEVTTCFRDSTQQINEA